MPHILQYFFCPKYRSKVLRRINILPFFLVKIAGKGCNSPNLKMGAVAIYVFYGFFQLIYGNPCSLP